MKKGIDIMNMNNRINNLPLLLLLKNRIIGVNIKTNQTGFKK